MLDNRRSIQSIKFSHLAMAKKGNVLVVDDEEVMRDVLETVLSQDGYRVDLAKTGEEGLARFGERPYDVVLLDVSMPGIGGLRTLEELLKLDREAAVIIGAFNCIRKPFENEQILKTVAAGFSRRRGDEERRVLRRTLKTSGDRNRIVGNSPAIREVYDLIEQVAPARSTVLITGESGTGKEVVARTIHFSSPRAESGQFVAVNCSNIPSELLESELFGHTKGAFTGAIAAKKGLFDPARNAGAPAARDSGAGVYASGRHATAPRGHTHYRGDEYRLAARRQKRRFSRRSVLSAQRHQHPSAAAAQPQGRYLASGAIFHPQIQRRKRTLNHRPDVAGSAQRNRNLCLARQCARTGDGHRARGHCCPWQRNHPGMFARRDSSTTKPNGCNWRFI
jgi:CheY-like chemotaxis protein